jgi:hypothetical protein
MNAKLVVERGRERLSAADGRGERGEFADVTPVGR